MTKVFLLTVDALRYDVIAEDIVPTPNIDRLLEDSVQYTRAFSHGCGTPMVFPGILCILYSSRDDNGRAPEKASIGNYFQDAGFQTIGITSNPYTSSHYGYETGFDVFKDFTRPTSEKEQSLVFKYGRKVVKKVKPLYNTLTRVRAKHDLPYKRAGELNEVIYDELKSGKDQFIWIHYMDTHAPYSPPKTYGKEHCPDAFKRRGTLTQSLYSKDVTEDEKQALWELYKTEVHYLDDKIGELLNRLDEYDEDIYIVFTSDHGEEFGEHGRFQHAQYFDVNIHIPLGFCLPDKTARIENKIACHLDILPTLLPQFTDISSDNFEGINLFSETRETLEITVNDTHVIITDKWKLIERSSEQYLFNRNEDPDETQNLYDDRPGIVQELKQQTVEDTTELDF